MISKPSNQGYKNNQKKFSSTKNEYNSYNSNDDNGRLNLNDTEFGMDESNEQQNMNNQSNQSNR